VRLASLGDFGDGRRLGADHHSLQAKSATEQHLDDLSKDAYELKWVIPKGEEELILIFKAPMSTAEGSRSADERGAVV